jgi:tetratricopeptide (TPR) repeat protein
MAVVHKPVVFIGSSTEASDVAKTIERTLKSVATTHLWQRVFEPGEFAIERLQTEAANVDFAIFVLAPDDVTITRHRQSKAPRDNVVFEAGLFMSILGRDRTFLVEDKRGHLKIPSDLMGITTLRYDGEAVTAANARARALRDVLDTLTERVSHLGPRGQTDLPTSIVRVLHELDRIDSRLPFTAISARYVPAIRSHLDLLFSHGHYARHAQAGSRMRRIFEDSGHYLEGIQVNQQVVKSLMKLGHEDDALWTELKGVAYLEILSGNHAPARAHLEELVDRASTRVAELPLFSAYAYRYLGISYLRDPVSSDLGRARENFDKALEVVGGIQQSRPSEYSRFAAKLDRNLAILELAQRGDHDAAIAKLEASRDAFEKLSDYEHHGISALAKARALISRASTSRRRIDLDDVNALIGQAERSATLLGWPEGVGNVHEVRAELLVLRGNRALGAKTRRHLFDQALQAARTAEASFRSTDARHRVAALDALVDRIEARRRNLKAGRDARSAS